MVWWKKPSPFRPSSLSCKLWVLCVFYCSLFCVISKIWVGPVCCYLLMNLTHHCFICFPGHKLKFFSGPFRSNLWLPIPLVGDACLPSCVCHFLIAFFLIFHADSISSNHQRDWYVFACPLSSSLLVASGFLALNHQCAHIWSYIFGCLLSCHFVMITAQGSGNFNGMLVSPTWWLLMLEHQCKVNVRVGICLSCGESSHPLVIENI